MLKKLFKSEKYKFLNILKNIEYTDLKIFNNLCNQSFKALKKEKKIIFFGHSDGTSDVQHLETELILKYKTKKNVKKLNLNVYAMLGDIGRKLKKFYKNNILITSKITYQSQVFDIFLCQILCKYIEKNIKKI